MTSRGVAAVVGEGTEVVGADVVAGTTVVVGSAARVVEVVVGAITSVTERLDERIRATAMAATATIEVTMITSRLRSVILAIRLPPFFRAWPSGDRRRTPIS
jgi:hypothetical protein